MTEILILAFADAIFSRLAVFAIASVVGALLIYEGLQNVKTKTAEVSGKRRLVNKALGASNTYEGDNAVRLGLIRIIGGIGLVVFGVVFIFVGPFLANAGFDQIANTISILLVSFGVVVVAVYTCVAFRTWKRESSRIDCVPCDTCGRLNSASTRICPRCMTKL